MNAAVELTSNDPSTMLLAGLDGALVSAGGEPQPSGRSAWPPLRGHMVPVEGAAAAG
jgi:hypothetical protein